ncbi:MAG: DUF2815 family protein, partial [Clostridia bacterium]
MCFTGRKRRCAQITGKVRASFVHVFEPQSVNGSEPKYACFFINANSKEKPGLVDRRRMPITDPLELYS